MTWLAESPVTTSIGQRNSAGNGIQMRHSRAMETRCSHLHCFRPTGQPSLASGHLSSITGTTAFALCGLDRFILAVSIFVPFEHWFYSHDTIATLSPTNNLQDARLASPPCSKLSQCIRRNGLRNSCDPCFSMALAEGDNSAVNIQLSPRNRFSSASDS